MIELKAHATDPELAGVLTRTGFNAHKNLLECLRDPDVQVRRALLDLVANIGGGANTGGLMALATGTIRLMNDDPWHAVPALVAMTSRTPAVARAVAFEARVSALSSVFCCDGATSELRQDCVRLADNLVASLERDSFLSTPSSTGLIEVLLHALGSTRTRPDAIRLLEGLSRSGAARNAIRGSGLWLYAMQILDDGTVPERKHLMSFLAWLAIDEWHRPLYLENSLRSTLLPTVVGRAITMLECDDSVLYTLSPRFQGDPGVKVSDVGSALRFLDGLAGSREEHELVAGRRAELLAALSMLVESATRRRLNVPQWSSGFRTAPELAVESGIGDEILAQEALLRAVLGPKCASIGLSTTGELVAQLLRNLLRWQNDPPSCGVFLELLRARLAERPLTKDDVRNEVRAAIVTRLRAIEQHGNAVERVLAEEVAFLLLDDVAVVLTYVAEHDTLEERTLEADGEALQAVRRLAVLAKSERGKARIRDSEVVQALLRLAGPRRWNEGISMPACEALKELANDVSGAELILEEGGVDRMLKILATAGTGGSQLADAMAGRVSFGVRGHLRAAIQVLEAFTKSESTLRRLRESDDIATQLVHLLSYRYHDVVRPALVVLRALGRNV